MLGEWLADLESLEAISQDDETRTLVLRLAAMSKAGTLEPFLVEINRDGDLDEETRATFAELAADESFLFAVEDYVRRTRVSH
jgi:hypothetical protein